MHINFQQRGAEQPRPDRGREGLYRLFGTPPSARVLAVGNLPPGWLRQSCERCPSVYQKPRSGYGHEYDLILYDAGLTTGYSDLVADLRRLKPLSARAGTLLVFGETGCAGAFLQRFLRRLKVSATTACESPASVLQAMVEAGWPHGEVFLSGSRLASSAAFERLGAARPDPGPAQGFAICAAPETLAASNLLRTVARQIAPDSNHKPELTLERFILRQRGAVILFVRDQQRGRQYISRLVTDDKTEQIVKRNHNFLHHLHSAARLPEADRRLLPIPLASTRYSGCSVLTETRLPGELAWPVCLGPLGARIEDGAAAFLIRLQEATRSLADFHKLRLHKLFIDDLRRLEQAADKDPALAYQVTQLAERLFSRLQGRSGILVAAHGDFGFGNLLVDPDTGALTGVIDWDTGRKKELPGVDWLNFRIQQQRIAKNSGLYPALRRVWREVRVDGGIDADGIYAGRFEVNGDMVGVTAAVALLRYMSRAANYPEIFASEQADYRKGLVLLLKTGAV